MASPLVISGRTLVGCSDGVSGALGDGGGDCIGDLTTSPKPGVGSGSEEGIVSGITAFPDVVAI